MEGATKKTESQNCIIVVEADEERIFVEDDQQV